MIAYVTLDTIHFAAVVLAGALLLLAHVAVVRSLVRERTLPPLLRFASLFPPVTPLLALSTGRITGAFVWTFFAGLYLVVRVLR